ncbi:MAG: ABC transporter permease [Spirochaetia bacterium]|nr:ABC transporter permease [Spirochaetia bacterium]
MENIRYYKAPAYYLFSLIKERKRIWHMAVSDFKNQYLKSYMGMFWAFFQPLIMIVIISLVIAGGLRGSGRLLPGNVPFVVYFVCGYVSWLFFADMLSRCSDSISSFSYLISKVDFPLFILPLVKIISVFFVHLAMVSAAFLIAYLNGFYPVWHWFQIIYFMFCAVMLMIGVSWLMASISMFIDDVRKVMPVFIQLGFWSTPIFWSFDMFPKWAQDLLKLNPAYYIVNGYRESLIYGRVFWEDPYLTLYFWGVTLFFLAVGSITYRNTRPHFAEVI